MIEKNDSSSQLVKAVRDQLKKAGLGHAELVSAASESTAFGDTAVVFRVGPLLLRVTCERGQQFVDMAGQAEPIKFHQFDDIEIAMGWRSVDEILAKRGPEPIEIVLQHVQANLGVLMAAFLEDQERFTRARVEKASRDRGQAFTARLRGK